MLESLITTLDKFTPEILVILSGLLVITTTLFLWLWFANRRTYNLLKHQLPAHVVKNYLDSVITNSSHLKDALFRGGGLDVNATAGAQNIPAVFPVMNAEAGSDAALREQLQQKLAELASLQSQLASANGVKKELETNLSGSKARIKELEDLLAKANKGQPVAAPAAGGGADPAELKKVTKERDELREKLKEYEIIEDDLANLKRLQQENAQLKKALGGNVPEMAAPISGGSEPVAKAAPISGGSDPLAGATDLFDDVPTPAPEEDATEELEQFLSTGSEGEAAPAPEVAAAAEPEAPKAPVQNEKTPEDLLSEFEKMLG